MPVDFSVDFDGQSKLVVWKISETRDELLSMITHGLTMDKYLPENMQWLASRALLVKLFPAHDVRLLKNKQNKPVLFVNNKPLNISITHSGNYAAVLISEILQTGVDLEKIDERINRVERKFMNEYESSFAQNITSKTIIWSAKETLFKLHYKNGIDFKYNLCIFGFKPHKKGMIKGLIELDETEMLCNISYLLFDNMVLTYCMKNIYEF
jgi:phosphopantetheinyl transferase